jgi:hypothetical protein
MFDPKTDQKFGVCACFTCVQTIQTVLPALAGMWQPTLTHRSLKHRCQMGYGSKWFIYHILDLMKSVDLLSEPNHEYEVLKRDFDDTNFSKKNEAYQSSNKSFFNSIMYFGFERAPGVRKDRSGVILDDSSTELPLSVSGGYDSTTDDTDSYSDDSEASTKRLNEKNLPRKSTLSVKTSYNSGNPVRAGPKKSTYD